MTLSQCGIRARSWPGTRFRFAIALLVAIFSSVVPTSAFADSAVAFGTNYYGEIGNGTIALNLPFGVTTPTGVIGMSSGVTAVASGASHSLAIQNGALYAWGFNNEGEFGDGTTTNQTAPALVPGFASGVTAVAGGFFSTLAVKSGAVYSWGGNHWGELGIGNTTDKLTPTPVIGLTSGVTAIALGNSYGLAIKNGAMYGWGNNGNGELGFTASEQLNTPVLVNALGSGVTQIAAGGVHSLVVQNGALYTFGYNFHGQLGDGTKVIQRDSPTALSGFASGVTSIAAGANHTVVAKDGGVYTWGWNEDGQLGDGGTLDRNTPLRIDAAHLNNIIAVAAGARSSYALSADGSLWTWGANNRGQLGLGNSVSFLTPQHVLPPVGFVFTSIGAHGEGQHVVATIAAVPEPSAALLALVGIGIVFKASGRRLRGFARRC